jgi:hypothetical protein
MKYIRTYDNFKPIKINSEKPFKVKKNIVKSVKYLQDRVKSLRRRISDEKDIKKRSDMNKDVNKNVKKISDLNFKNLKQIEYLRNNPIKEELENIEELENNENLKDVISSPDFNIEDIEKYIGIDDDDYQLDFFDGYYSNNKEEFKLFVEESTLTDLLNIENGAIDFFMQFQDYNNYEYNVNDDELNYLHCYLDENSSNKIKTLAKAFKYKLKINKHGYEEDTINDFLTYLGLIDFEKDILIEISYEKERCVTKEAKRIIESLPFEISYEYNNKFNYELIFNIDTIFKYIEENKLDNIKTIKDFLENISESSELTYEVEYQSDGDADYKNLNKSIGEELDKFINSPDEVFPYIIMVDSLSAIKKNIKLALFDYHYEIRFNYDEKKGNLFELAIEVNGKIYDWFKSDEFATLIKKIGDNDSIAAYNEFLFGENVKRYNI